MQADFAASMDQQPSNPLSMAARPKKKLSLKAKAWAGVAVLCLLLVAAIVLAVYFATRSQACPKQTCQSSCKASWDASTNSCVNDVSVCQSTCQGNWDAAHNVCRNTVSQACQDSCNTYGLAWQPSATTPTSGTCTIDFTQIKGSTGEFTPGATPQCMANLEVLTGPTGEFTSGSTPVCVASTDACKAGTQYDGTNNTCISTVTCQDSCNTYGVQWESSSSSCTVDFDKLKGSTGEFTPGATPQCVANLAVLTGPTGSTGEFTSGASPTCVASSSACTGTTTYNPESYTCDPPPTPPSSSCMSCNTTKPDTSNPSTWVSCNDTTCVGTAHFNKGVSCTGGPSVGYQPSLDAVLDAMKSKNIAPDSYPFSYITSPNPKDPNGEGSFTYSVCPRQTPGTNNFTPTTGSFGEYMVVFNPFGNIAPLL